MTDAPSPRCSSGITAPPADLAARIEIYIGEAPGDGGHCDAAGANCWELLREAMEELRAPTPQIAGGVKDQRLEKLEDRRNGLLNDFGNGSFQDGLTRSRLQQVENEIAALSPQARAGETLDATEQGFLEDNIATVAFHLGRSGATMNVNHQSGGLYVSEGEVLKEVSRRLGVAQAEQKPVAWQRRFRSSTTGAWGEWESSRISEGEFRYKFGYLLENGECELRYLCVAPSLSSTDRGGK